MSQPIYFKNNPIRINNKNTIQLNYPITTIYPSGFQKTLANGGFIQIPFTNTNTNVTLQTSTSTPYTSTNLYIYGKIFNIPDIPYDGVLVIENAPNTNDASTKLYTCILLQKSANASGMSPTVVDQIIGQSVKQTAQTLSVEINQLLGESTNDIIYLDTTGHQVVIVLATSLVPVQIISDLSKYSTSTTLFDQSYPQGGTYSIINGTEGQGTAESFVTKEGFKEGLDDLYIDCTPTDVDPATVATYALPINSGLMADINQTNFMNTAINFFVFLMLCVVANFAVPIWYKTFIMDVIRNGGTDDEYARLSAVDKFLGVVVFIFSLALAIDGIKEKNVLETTVGIMSFVIFMVSFMILWNKKANDETFNFKDLNQTASMGDFGQFANDTWRFILTHFQSFFAVFLFVLSGVWIPVLAIWRNYPNLLPNPPGHALRLIAGYTFSFGTVFSIYLTKMMGVKLEYYE